MSAKCLAKPQPAVTSAAEPWVEVASGACVSLAFRFEPEASEPFLVLELADDGQPLRAWACATLGEARARWRRLRRELAVRGFRRMQ